MSMFLQFTQRAIALYKFEETARHAHIDRIQLLLFYNHLRLSRPLISSSQVFHTSTYNSSLSTTFSDRSHFSIDYKTQTIPLWKENLQQTITHTQKTLTYSIVGYLISIHRIFITINRIMFVAFSIIKPIDFRIITLKTIIRKICLLTVTILHFISYIFILSASI